MPASYSEQSAGLSTAENDKDDMCSIDSSRGSECGSCSGPVAPKVFIDNPNPGQRGGATEKRTDTATPTPTKESHSSSIASPPPRSRRARKLGSASPLNLSGSSVESIGGSAPTILVRDYSSSSVRPVLRSAMSARTLHESLHGRGKRSAAAPGSRRNTNANGVRFARVEIREHERVIGDNPSVTSGPPLSIGWRHAPEPTVVSVDDYERGRGAPRASGEYLVPRQVRESLLREQAGVSRREIAEVVRAVSRGKAARRKTVVNLNMSGAEERVEGARRKLKKILRRSSYDAQEAKLWDDAHAIAIEKARRLEESIRRGESVSLRNVYSVGTPRDGMMPSRTNSVPMIDAHQSKSGEEDPSRRQPEGAKKLELTAADVKASEATAVTEEGDLASKVRSSAVKQFQRYHSKTASLTATADGTAVVPANTRKSPIRRTLSNEVVPSEPSSSTPKRTSLRHSWHIDGEESPARPISHGSAHIIASESGGDFEDALSRLLLEDASASNHDSSTAGYSTGT